MMKPRTTFLLTIISIVFTSCFLLSIIKQSFEKDGASVSIISVTSQLVVKVATDLHLSIYGKWTWVLSQTTHKYNTQLFASKYLNLTLLLHVSHAQIKTKFLLSNKLFLEVLHAMIHMILEQTELFHVNIAGYNLKQ
jgi:hypothetical protein